VFRFLLQAGIVSISLLFSTVAAWYEGSAILTDPWEWKYSTPFSQLFYDEIQSSNQILQLDHFIYAAKFQPTFPAIMIISSLYLLILTGHHLLRRHRKLFTYYLSFLGGGLFLLSYFTFNSPTLGGQILFYIWLLSGGFCTITAMLFHFQILNRNSNEVVS